jgi:hypothetical protein
MVSVLTGKLPDQAGTISFINKLYQHQSHFLSHGKFNETYFAHSQVAFFSSDELVPI